MITGPSDTIKRARLLRSEMTLPEGILWRELRQRPEGLKFRRQHPAGIYVLDFYCAAARLAIEVDGWVHDNAPAQQADAARGHFLRAQGIATLRVPAKVVLNNLPAAVARIVEVCGVRVGRHSSPVRGGGPAKLVEGHTPRSARADASEPSPVPLHHPADGPPPRSGEE